MSEGGKQETGDVFDVERIRRLVRLMEEHGLAEIDLRQDEERINLKRAIGVSNRPSTTQELLGPEPTRPEPRPEPTRDIKDIDGPNIVVIKAPMVGTFYNRPNPESEAFVKVGSSVNADTTICIIEAMKVFNEIPAEISGKVVAVMVENEQSVEYGKPLFKIDTSA